MLSQAFKESGVYVTLVKRLLSETLKTTETSAIGYDL